MIKKFFAFAAMFFTLLLVVSSQPLNAQNSNDLSPQTRQYIDNYSEVKQAQNDGKPADTSPTGAKKGTSTWTYVFYGALSGAAYGFWRWVRKLKNPG